MTRHFVHHRAISSGGASGLTVSMEIYGAALETYSETEWLEGTRAVHDR